MYFNLTVLKEEVVEGQPQKHCKVEFFSDAEKTQPAGETLFVAGGAAYDDPEAELQRTLKLPEPPIKEPTYIHRRRDEYPPITDYLDGVVKGDQAQIEKYIADCLAVKAKYPKE